MDIRTQYMQLSKAARDLFRHGYSLQSRKPSRLDFLNSASDPHYYGAMDHYLVLEELRNADFAIDTSGYLTDRAYKFLCFLKS